MGVNVKMVTGDQLAIARETAGQLGLGQNILDASGFDDTRHHETAQLEESIEKAMASPKCSPNTSSTSWMSCNGAITSSE